MTFREIGRRGLALTLAVLMTTTLLPVGARATDSGTVEGKPQTVPVTGGQNWERETNFNKGWKFYLGNNSSAQNQNFDDSSWQTVDLPHDFSIFQNFTTGGEAESGFLPGGTGWYRKAFTMSERDAQKSVLLNFDGVYSDTYVYVNGTLVGEHHYGYTSFAFDISPYLHFDGSENVVAVKAVNNIPSSRWYSGSGIYRDVTLIVTDPVHVDQNGTYVTTPDISTGGGKVQVEVDVVNDGDSSANVTVTNTVYRKGSETQEASASVEVTVAAGHTEKVTASPVVANPALWSLDQPNLYVVKTELSVDGTVVDTYESTFGFRYMKFDSRGFHLNNQNVKINGVCMHHDQGALGAAAYYDAMYRQLTILKDMGCNAIRTSHNPADEQFIEICSELGLLVVEEAFDGWLDVKNSNRNDFSQYFDRAIGSDNHLYGASASMTWAEFAIKSMVKRDRNEPSVIAWSLGNEIQEGTSWQSVGQFAGVAKNLIDWVKQVDTTRPTTSGDNNRGGDRQLVDVINTITSNGGIAGFNYCNSASDLSNLANRFGGSTGCIIASETASATNSRGVYNSQRSNTGVSGRNLTSYDTSAVSWGITAHESIYNTYQNDNVAGEFVWTGFDYIGEPTPYNGTVSGTAPGGSGATPNSSYFGIIETTGFEKDTYYLYRSQWNKDATTLHLVTAWDQNNMISQSGKTPVWVYSNAPVVKLYKDGALIGTATRQEHTSPAGHTYYTYTTKTQNGKVCQTSSGSGSEGLYAVFNVAYSNGTLSAKAFREDGKTEIELTGNSGKNTVSTPGASTNLVVSQDKTEIPADGSSLVYITVDVTDGNGNLKTKANDTITVSLSGNGEILGVDNGDQTTVNKYQQKSVLSGPKSAKIQAYAGKALVIVRSTDTAGSFTVNLSSGSGSKSVNVTTTAVEAPVASGLVSYTMVKDYSVKTGVVPVLQTTATGMMADGTEIDGTIVWEPIASETYDKAGDYVIKGQLNFEGQDTIAVTCKLHVIDRIVAMRNVAAVTAVGTAPALPNTVAGVLADGKLSGEFSVTWDRVDAAKFNTVGSIVTVSGTVSVFGDETMPVSASVRVAEMVNTKSSNVAPQASKLSQDIAPNMQSDNLESIRNDVTKPGDDTRQRWTNWKNRTASDTATLTFQWDTAQMLSGVNLYYYFDNCCAMPQNVEFLYSANGNDYQPIEYTATQVENYSLGAQYAYTFSKPINPVALRIVLTQQGGTSGVHCVGLTEVQIMTFAGKVEQNSSAALSGITVDGLAVNGFAPEKLDYETAGTKVGAQTDVNAAITVLPSNNNMVYILTLSEDGTDSRLYRVTLTGSGCAHANTGLRNAADATCTAEGYTGDTYCLDCGETIQKGEVIPATGHLHTEVRNAQTATCTTEGYTGDTYCLDCSEMIQQGETIPATGHLHTEVRDAQAASCTVEGYTGDTYCADCDIKLTSGTTIAPLGHAWDNGVVTVKPTATTSGTKIYTCTRCKETRTEELPPIKQKKEPSVSLEVTKNAAGKIVMNAKVDDYANLSDYYEITGHGILYTYEYRLQYNTLHINSRSRTNLRFSWFRKDGSYDYTLTPQNQNASYAFRAYVCYKHPDTGRTVYVYSDLIKGSVKSLPLK